MTIRRRPLALLFVVLPVLVAAQAPRRAPMGLETARRALLEGRYDDVQGLVEGLDAGDPAVASVTARAAVARGRYADAEVILRPVATGLPTSEAALELALLQKMLGRADGDDLLTKVAMLAGSGRTATELARGGRALRALERFQLANAAYREAATVSPKDPAINTGWGELFLDAHDPPNALTSFQAALQADPKWVPALLGMARVMVEEKPSEAQKLAKQALAVNPSSVETMVFMAEQEAESSRPKDAREWLQKALAVNPSSLPARALAGGLLYVEDKTSEFETEANAALAIAPRYGEFFRVAASMAAHNYRFDEAVALTRRALVIDPKNTRSLAELGLHLLRTGDEPGARTTLEAAFNTDPFDVITHNLLFMLDALDKFQTITDGDLVVRMREDEAPVLKEYVLSLAHRALTTLAARYEFQPKGPILIEVFPKHDDFAVRNLGLPGMSGALGACFGRVVTMDSPKARPPGDFQWEATLWHELAHVITIQMSNQRIPRWLTEGISVYEEKRARPDWARPMDVQFAGMLNRGETLKLSELNSAYTDPKKVQLAYFQGALVVDHIVTTFGEAGLRKLVRAYGQGLDTDAALKASLGTSFDELQPGFSEAMEKAYGAVRRALVAPKGVDLNLVALPELRALASANAGSFPVQMALGRALQKEGELNEAIAVFERAARLVPMAAGRDGSPHASIAAVALQQKDTKRAIAALQALMGIDFDNIKAARQLADLLRQAKVDDTAVLQPVYERIVAIDPYDIDGHAALGRLAIRRNELETASREFRAVIALGPVDRAAALVDLAESYFKAGRAADARRQARAALEIAPAYERAQDLWLRLADARR